MQDLFAKITVIIHVKSIFLASRPTVTCKFAKYNRASSPLSLTFNAKRRKNMIDRPNDPSIENGHALRREILPKADAELDCRIQKSAQVAHSASRQVIEHHDGPGYEDPRPFGKTGVRRRMGEGVGGWGHSTRR